MCSSEERPYELGFNLPRNESIAISRKRQSHHVHVAMEAIIYPELFSDWLAFYRWEGCLRLICFALRISPGATWVGGIITWK